MKYAARLADRVRVLLFLPVALCLLMGSTVASDLVWLSSTDWRQYLTRAYQFDDHVAAYWTHGIPGGIELAEHEFKAAERQFLKGSALRGGERTLAAADFRAGQAARKIAGAIDKTQRKTAFLGVCYGALDGEMQVSSKSIAGRVLQESTQLEEVIASAAAVDAMTLKPEVVQAGRYAGQGEAQWYRFVKSANGEILIEPIDLASVRAKVRNAWKDAVRQVIENDQAMALLQREILEREGRQVTIEELRRKGIQELATLGGQETAETVGSAAAKNVTRLRGAFERLSPGMQFGALLAIGVAADLAGEQAKGLTRSLGGGTVAGDLVALGVSEGIVIIASFALLGPVGGAVALAGSIVFAAYKLYNLRQEWAEKELEHDLGQSRVRGDPFRDRKRAAGIPQRTIEDWK